jgi:hypothetical protein
LKRDAPHGAAAQAIEARAGRICPAFLLISVNFLDILALRERHFLPRLKAVIAVPNI